MNKVTLTRTMLASSVAAAGLTLGGIGLSAAADDAAPQGPGIGHHGGLADDLADELGISQDTVESALEAVRPDDGERPTTPPSQEEMAAKRSEFAAALAKELGLSEAKVTAALEAIHDDHQAEARGGLEQRLDDAVAAGTLTADDKAAVLKAFDADVLGGPGGPRHH